jgi:hypothetical protein
MREHKSPDSITKELIKAMHVSVHKFVVKYQQPYKVHQFAFTMCNDIGCRRNTKDFLIEILKGVVELFNAAVR